MKTTSLILLATMVVSCGKKTSTTRKKIHLSEGQISYVMANQSFNCPEDGCPEGVGRLFAIDANDAEQSGVCSSFLIGPRTVMTNSHCVFIPGHNLEQTCKGIYFAFPDKDNNYYHQARCSKIIWRDPGQNGDHFFRKGDKDFALVELDQEIPLPPLELNPHGPSIGDVVNPLVVDQIDLLKSSIFKLSCTVIDIDKTFGVAQISNCPVISGNSGSAVVDYNNEVVAIMVASTNASAREAGKFSTTRSYSTSGFVHTVSFIKKILGRLIDVDDKED